MMPRRNSIRALGLKAYVDEWSAKRSLRFHYDDLAAMIENDTSIVSMAKNFKTAPGTMSKWVVIYYEELLHRRLGDYLNSKSRHGTMTS